MSLEAGMLGWVDWVLLGVLAVSLAVGLWRGLVFEVLSLIGWIAAYVTAQLVSPAVATWLPVGVPGGALNHGAAFALTLIAVLMVWVLAARLLRALIHATPLQAIDRMLGAVFGLARGGVLLLAVATVVALTPAVRSPAWQHSQGAAWLGALLAGLKPALPEAVSRHLPA
ncbi:MAG: CvpA family protein [Aquincola sp.]|nr:CvpA family protein [Aquincola sp.]